MPEFPGDRRERSIPHFPERRGRKSVYQPPWTVPQLAKYISHSPDFVLSKIHSGEIVGATKFGSEWRIPFSEVRRYLLKKNYPLPDEAA